MKLIKIHRILSFKQKNWLKIFTDFNTKKRKESNDKLSMAKVSKIQEKKLM